MAAMYNNNNNNKHDAVVEHRAHGRGVAARRVRLRVALVTMERMPAAGARLTTAMAASAWRAQCVAR